MGLRPPLANALDGYWLAEDKQRKAAVQAWFGEEKLERPVAAGKRVEFKSGGETKNPG